MHAPGGVDLGHAQARGSRSSPHELRDALAHRRRRGASAASASRRTRRLEPHSAQSMLSRSTNESGQVAAELLREDPRVAHEPRLGAADGAAASLVAAPVCGRAQVEQQPQAGIATQRHGHRAPPRPGPEPAGARIAPTVANRTQAFAPPVREQRLRDMRGEHHEAAAPRPEWPERRVPLADRERVAQPVVERRRRALAAGRGGDAVHDAGVGHDVEARTPPRGRAATSPCPRCRGRAARRTARPARGRPAARAALRRSCDRSRPPT